MGLPGRRHRATTRPRHPRRSGSGVVSTAALAVVGATSRSAARRQPDRATRQPVTIPGPGDWPTYGHDAQHTFHGTTTLTAGTARRPPRRVVRPDRRRGHRDPHGRARDRLRRLVGQRLLRGRPRDRPGRLDLPAVAPARRHALPGGTGPRLQLRRRPHHLLGLVPARRRHPTRPGDLRGRVHALRTRRAHRHSLLASRLHRRAGAAAATGPGRRPHLLVTGRRGRQGPLRRRRRRPARRTRLRRRRQPPDRPAGVDLRDRRRRRRSPVEQRLRQHLVVRVDPPHRWARRLRRGGLPLPEPAADRRDRVRAAHRATGTSRGGTVRTVPTTAATGTSAPPPTSVSRHGGHATFLGVGAKDGTYYSLDPATGRLRWKTNVVFGGFTGGFIAHRRVRRRDHRRVHRDWRLRPLREQRPPGLRTGEPG